MFNNVECAEKYKNQTNYNEFSTLFYLISFILNLNNNPYFIDKFNANKYKQKKKKNTKIRVQTLIDDIVMSNVENNLCSVVDVVVVVCVFFFSFGFFSLSLDTCC